MVSFVIVVDRKHVIRVVEDSGLRQRRDTYGMTYFTAVHGLILERPGQFVGNGCVINK